MNIRSLVASLLAKSNREMARALQLYRIDRAKGRVEFCDSPMGFRFPKHAMWQCNGFERAEVQFVNQLAEHCQLFVDIGADNGLYSMIAVKRGLKVVAVEPCPESVYYLCRTCLENRAEAVEVLASALGAKIGFLELYGRGVLASLDVQWAMGYNQDASIKPTLVPVNTLDNILRGRCGKDTRVLIKVDVEGTEYQVLQGGAESFEMRPGAVWLVEITLQAKRPGVNATFERTFEPFFRRSYRVYGFTDAGIRKVTREQVARWQKSGSQDYKCENWLFVPPDLVAFDVEKDLPVMG